MKKLLTLLFSLLISFNSYGGLFDKTVCVETDSQERGGLIYLPNKTKPFSGKNLCEYKSGQYKSQGKIKKGVKDGKWIEWNENGIKQTEALYKDGEWFGETQYGYHQNGQKYSEESYNYLGWRSKLSLWFENGQKQGEESYKGNSFELERDGKSTAWDKNGQIVSESNWKDGECISGDCPS